MSVTSNDNLNIIMKENNLSLSNEKFSELRYDARFSNAIHYFVVKKDVSEFVGFGYLRPLVIENVKDKNVSRTKLYISGVTPWYGEEKVEDLQKNYFLLRNDLVLPKGYIAHSRNLIGNTPINSLILDKTVFEDMYAFKLVKIKSKENNNLEYNNSDAIDVKPYKLTIKDKGDKENKEKVLCVNGNIYGCIKEFKSFEDLFKEYVSGYKPKTDKKGGTRRRRRGSKGGSRKNRRSRKSM